jgi:hypothetical protein
MSEKYPADDASFEASTAVVERVDDAVMRHVHRRWQQAAIDQQDTQADTAWQRQQLHDSVNASMEQYHAPLQRQALEDFAAITDYLWFGTDTTPLPEALTTSTSMLDDEAIMTFNFERMSPTDFNRCAQAVREQGLDVLETHRARMFEEQGKTLFWPAVRSYITNTPGYRLLESFIGEFHELHDLPLTNTRKMIYEQQAVQAIRQRWQMAPSEQLSTSTHPAAKLELDKATTRIDMYTEPQRVSIPEEVTPRDVARDILSGAAHYMLGRGIRGSEITSIETQNYSHPSTLTDRPNHPFPTLHIVTDEERVHFTPESMTTWLMEVQGVVYPGDSVSRYVSERMITDVALHVFDDDGDQGSFQSLLGQLVKDRTDTLYDELVGIGAKLGDQPFQSFNRLNTFLQRPRHAMSDYGIGVLSSRPDVMYQKEQLTSWHDLREMLKKTVGNVLRRPAHDTASRVMGFAVADASTLMGEHDSRASLVIQARSNLLMGNPAKGLFPQVPGYTLVSHNAHDNTFGYAYQPDQDPYIRCDIPLSAEGRQRLLDAYQALGLTRLHRALSADKQPTVDDLVRMIAATGKYYHGKDTRSIDTPQCLEDFAKSLERQTMYLQCKQWSLFVRYSLDRAFEPGVSTIIGGSCLSARSNRIPFIGHAQTRFVDPQSKRQYILDGTPGGFDITMLKELFGSLGQTIGRLVTPKTVDREGPFRQTDQATQQHHHRATRLHHGETPNRQHLLEANTEQAIMHLCMAFGQHNRMLGQAELFDMVATRGKDDILFRAMAALLASKQGRPDAANEVESALHLITRLQECEDQQLVSKLDPHKYTQHPWLSDSLVDALAQASRLLRSS